MSFRTRLQSLALAKLVIDTVKAASNADKSELMDEVGGRMGATAAILPDGTECATVSISAGRSAKWQVVDRRAWVEHVRKVRPTAIVETVRESDEEDLLSKIDPTGDIPPGVMLGDPGSPYVTINQSEEQKANLIRAWQSGAVELPSFAPPEVEQEPAVVEPVEGWGFPTSTARKAHYFVEHRSLCGKYGDFGVTLTADDGTSRDDCKLCRFRLDKRGQ